jgi:hypothetical protein
MKYTSNGYNSSMSNHSLLHGHTDKFEEKNENGLNETNVYIKNE